MAHKVEIGQYVEQALGVRLVDFGEGMSKNALYKQIASEIGNLREQEF